MKQLFVAGAAVLALGLGVLGLTHHPANGVQPQPRANGVIVVAAVSNF